MSQAMVPEQLLLDRQLPDSAKLLWVAMRLLPGGTAGNLSITKLMAVSGLSFPTVSKGLRLLKACQGWDGAGGRPAILPAALLADRVSVKEKLLYGVLQFTPRFEHPHGQVSHSGLGLLWGEHPATVRKAMSGLANGGWVAVSQRNQRSPICFTLRDPVQERQKREVANAGQRLKEADYLGEEIMREYLSLIVDSDQFEDNASPGFLVNPYTGERLQFDRYYPPKVALEFNGPQHYRPTERYPSETEAMRQQARDYIKAGICALRGIRLIVLLPEDLSLSGIRSKVDGLLPLRDLSEHQPLVGFLESVARGYRRRVGR